MIPVTGCPGGEVVYASFREWSEVEFTYRDFVWLVTFGGKSAAEAVVEARAVHAPPITLVTNIRRL